MTDEILEVFDINGVSYTAFTEEDCDVLEWVYGSLYWVPLPENNEDFKIMMSGVLIKKKPADKQTAMQIARRFL